MTDLICVTTPPCSAVIPPAHECSYLEPSVDLQQKIHVLNSSCLWIQWLTRHDRNQDLSCYFRSICTLKPWDHIKHHNRTLYVPYLPHENLWKLAVQEHLCFAELEKAVTSSTEQKQDMHWSRNTAISPKTGRINSRYTEHPRGHMLISVPVQLTHLFVLEITKTVLSA